MNTYHSASLFVGDFVAFVLGLQVWIIADKVQGSHSLSCGTVCHRLAVQPMQPKGQSWDYGIGVKKPISVTVQWWKITVSEQFLSSMLV